MSNVLHTHFWTGRTEAAPKQPGRRRTSSSLKVARCGVRIGTEVGMMTTARNVVTCQRCRNFLESDRRKTLRGGRMY